MIENILLILLILLFCAKIVGAFFEKIGLDSSIGELLTGIVLGPSFLNLIEAKSIEYFAIIGSVLILFVVGMKQENVSEIYHDKKAIFLGVLLFIVTGLLMTAFFYYVPQYFSIHFSLIQSIILGIAFAIIDIGVPAKILLSKGLIQLPVGRILIRSAIIDIILGLFTFTIVSTLINIHPQDILFKFGGIILFTVIAVLIFYFFSSITKFVMKLHIQEAEFSVALILILALAYFTEVIGFSSILGAFIAGVLITRMPFSESKSFSDKIKAISFGLFVPLFFVWFGLEVNISEIMKNIVLAGIIFVIYVLIRFVTTYIYLRKNKLEAPLLVSASTISVDIESLIVLMIAINLGFFSDSLPLNLFAPSVLLSTVLIVILVAIFSKKELKKLDKSPIKE